MIRLILFFILAPFSLYAQSSEPMSTYQFRNDTLWSSIRLCNPNHGNSFYEILGIKVDSNFIIIDSLAGKVNKVSANYNLFILSNKKQEEYAIDSPCERDHGKRVFLLFLSSNDKTKVLVNENVVLNNFEYQSNPYRKATSTNSGFKLSFYIGTRIRYYYDFYFEIDKGNDFYLHKLESTCYDIHLSGSNRSRKKTYNSNNFTKLASLNIRSFITYY